MEYGWLRGLVYVAAICSVAATDNSEGQDESDTYMEPLDDHEPSSTNLHGNGQWFPSFARFDQPPLGHSRPFFNTFQQQEGAFSQRSEPPYQQQVDKEVLPQQQPQERVDAAASILGDGNFGVIEGGTFYPQKDGYDSEGGFDDYSTYFHNGHGRPSFVYGRKPNPKAYTHKQFENFRDFADINTTPDRQYSQYVVVYTNKNGEEQLAKQPKQPKNIIESLAMLEEEATKGAAPVPTKKLSKSKMKLALLLPEKKHRARLLKKEKETSEPLLALS
ncbi:uncharacterized protein LOC132702090 [Cylas formicarius]|uniref:uncharacterized protein LOC132702090 n=1 Tax=Cylas formicarius TaxID=197179 RepID=UPI002958765D|nr:uncharacterized protein LOC132702090 [Cylas formicarius]